MLTIDRAWDLPGAYRRPLAGWSSFPLSTGPARLAMAGGAGVVLGFPVLRPGGGWRGEWEPLLDARDFDSAEQLTDVLVDALERRLGERPADYLLSLGRGRAWDAAAGRWRAEPPAAGPRP